MDLTQGLFIGLQFINYGYTHRIVSHHTSLLLLVEECLVQGSSLSITPPTVGGGVCGRKTEQDGVKFGKVTQTLLNE